MIALAWKLLTSRAAGPIGAGLALVLSVALLASCGVQRAQQGQIDKLAGAVAAAERDLGICRSNVTGLTASVDAQNRQIAAWQAESARKTEAAAKALEAAQRGRSEAEARAAKLLKTQPAGVDFCARVEAADQAVLEALR